MKAHRQREKKERMICQSIKQTNKYSGIKTDINGEKVSNFILIYKGRRKKNSSPTSGQATERGFPKVNRKSKIQGGGGQGGQLPSEPGAFFLEG